VPRYFQYLFAKFPKFVLYFDEVRKTGSKLRFDLGFFNINQNFRLEFHVEGKYLVDDKMDVP
jgi:hypothetical protein